jgi:hypothetical protein
MCSSHLIYLLDLGEVTEEVMGGLAPGLEGKWWGTIELASSLNLEPLRS